MLTLPPKQPSLPPALTLHPSPSSLVQPMEVYGNYPFSSEWVNRNMYHWYNSEQDLIEAICKNLCRSYIISLYMYKAWIAFSLRL